MLSKQKLVWSLASIVILFSIPAISRAQAATDSVRATSAYAELLLKRTELKADLESVTGDYTETNPKLLDLRFELAGADRALARLLSVKANDVGKLTLALGKMMLRKLELETEQARLLRRYSKDHPEVRRLNKRIEIYELSISEILK